MCGVWGFVAAKGKSVNMAALARVAKATEARGRDAFGFAWLDGSVDGVGGGRLRAYKKTGRVSDHLSLLRMVSQARAIIGHCRLATHGSAQHNINNHPHPCDGGWIVHNGVVRNHAELSDQHDLPPVSDCDSEVLAGMIETFYGDLEQRVVDAVAETPAGSPLALLGLWPRPGKLLAVRRGNPLCWSRRPEGVYLASLPNDMPGAVRTIPDGSGAIFTEQNTGEWDVDVFEVEVERVDPDSILA
jgi:glucosamine 6-phosphate synthetase-like amidotransferase/phosphosugar isomerase protein